MIPEPLSNIESIHNVQPPVTATSVKRPSLCILLQKLTPKVLLSSVGTIWTSGRLVQFQFMLRFFEIFMEDVVFYMLRVHIIFSKIRYSGKKL